MHSIVRNTCCPTPSNFPGSTWRSQLFLALQPLLHLLLPLPPLVPPRHIPLEPLPTTVHLFRRHLLLSLRPPPKRNPLRQQTPVDRLPPRTAPQHPVGNRHAGLYRPLVQHILPRGA